MKVVPRLLTKKPAFPVQRTVVRSDGAKAVASNGCVAGGLAWYFFCAAELAGGCADVCAPTPAGWIVRMAAMVAAATHVPRARFVGVMVRIELGYPDAPALGMAQRA